MAEYISEKLARDAGATLEKHRDDGAGWCDFCWANGRIRVRYGDCDGYVNASAVLCLWGRQQGCQRGAVEDAETVQLRPPRSQARSIRRPWPSYGAST